jgi:hypothetical protein
VDKYLACDDATVSGLSGPPAEVADCDVLRAEFLVERANTVNQGSANEQSRRGQPVGFLQDPAVGVRPVPCEFVQAATIAVGGLKFLFDAAAGAWANQPNLRIAMQCPKELSQPTGGENRASVKQDHVLATGRGDPLIPPGGESPIGFIPDELDLTQRAEVLRRSVARTVVDDGQFVGFFGGIRCFANKPSRSEADYE